MGELKYPLVQRQASSNAPYVNPLIDLKHNRSCSEGNPASFSDNKENVVFGADKENAAPSTNNGSSSSSSEVAKKTTTHLKSPSTIGTFDASKEAISYKSLSTGKVLKESSLQFCMQMNEPDKAFGCKLWDPVDSDNSASLNIWDYSDSEAAPASSWSTLPNRSVSEHSLLLLLLIHVMCF